MRELIYSAKEIAKLAQSISARNGNSRDCGEFIFFAHARFRMIKVRWFSGYNNVGGGEREGEAAVSRLNRSAPIN